VEELNGPSLVEVLFSVACSKALGTKYPKIPPIITPKNNGISHSAQERIDRFFLTDAVLGLTVAVLANLDLRSFHPSNLTYIK
jgi:hypothetical protein